MGSAVNILDHLSALLLLLLTQQKQSKQETKKRRKQVPHRSERTSVSTQTNISSHYGVDPNSRGDRRNPSLLRDQCQGGVEIDPTHPSGDRSRHPASDSRSRSGNEDASSRCMVTTRESAIDRLFQVARRHGRP